MRCHALRVTLLLLAMLMCSAGCGAEPARPPAAAGATVTTASPSGSGSAAPAAPAAAVGDDDPPGTCGSEVCELDQFCEDLYKGHALDARGRPLQRQKCMPLPDACKAKPTCACVTRQVSSTHCKEDGGRVYLDDHPDRR